MRLSYCQTNIFSLVFLSVPGSNVLLLPEGDGNAPKGCLPINIKLE